LQLLASQINAVTYLELDATENDAPKKGLFYTLKEKDAAFIITDTFILKDGDIIRLFMNNENYPIALKNRKNIGLGYWQFECMRVAEKRKPAHTKKGYDFI
jgi:phage major head subunit gpT-like protein